MGEFFDERFAGEEQEQDFSQGEAPEFPDELVEPLQELTQVGHLTDSFTYGGQDFVIRTMTIGEELEALRVTKDYHDIPVAAGRVYATAMVAGAVQMLNGSPLAMPISERQNVMEIKFRKVKEWFWPVIEIVYRRYEQLERQQKEVLDGLQNTLDEGDPTQESSDPVE